MKREIVLDTETTGLDPFSGHRMVEIGCVELVGGLPTGEVFHRYLNPNRDVPDEAFRVHGLSTEFLRDKPMFSEIVDDFTAFIADAPLVIHNAVFDMKFINYELSEHGFAAIDAARIIDTLVMARKKFPGSPASLDALCKRFSIDLSARTKHGALLDAELLADVYMELMGGRQSAFGLDAQTATKGVDIIQEATLSHAHPMRHFTASDEELAAHADLVAQLKNPIWQQVAE